jgi:hypothetical protein
MLEVLSKMYGRAILRRLKNANHPNHMRPVRRWRFYLAVQIERLTFAPGCDISLRKKRELHVSPNAIHAHVYRSPMSRLVAAEPSCAR